MVIFVSLVAERRHISNKFYYIRFVHCNNTGTLRKLQHMSGQTVGSKQTHFFAPDSRQLLGDNIPVGSVSV